MNLLGDSGTFFQYLNSNDNTQDSNDNTQGIALRNGDYWLGSTDKYFDDETQKYFIQLLDPKTKYTLRVPEDALKLVTKGEVTLVGETAIKTSRRSNSSF